MAQTQPARSRQGVPVQPAAHYSRLDARGQSVSYLDKVEAQHSPPCVIVDQGKRWLYNAGSSAARRVHGSRSRPSGPGRELLAMGIFRQKRRRTDNDQSSEPWL